MSAEEVRLLHAVLDKLDCPAEPDEADWRTVEETLKDIVATYYLHPEIMSMVSTILAIAERHRNLSVAESTSIGRVDVGEAQLLRRINDAGFLVDSSHQRTRGHWWVTLRKEDGPATAAGVGGTLSEALAAAWASTATSPARSEVMHD